MNLPTVFETCEPREDVLKGTIDFADFAADLAAVIRGTASPDYTVPARFFANTYPTQGLKNLLANVLARITGDPSATACIFRLDTTYGGGKTHGLIALGHPKGQYHKTSDKTFDEKGRYAGPGDQLLRMLDQ